MKKGFPILPAFLGICHAASDCVAGLLIASLAPADVTDKGLLVLLYNVLAFAGQLPAGMLADRIGNYRRILTAALLAGAGALWLFPHSPMVAVGMAGIASAFFHVSGGAVALLATPGKASGPGLFAAPGVIGLVLGGWMGALSWYPLVPLSLVLLALALGSLWIADEWELPASPQSHAPALETHDLLMILLLLGIAFRSAAWNVIQAWQAGEHSFLLVLALGAASGKAMGGFLADYFGWRNWSVSALLASVIAFSFAAWQKWLCLPAVFLLQSATAPAIAAMRALMPSRVSTAAGLSLGLGIAAGGIPLFSGFDIPLSWTFALPIVAGIIYYFAIRKQVLTKAPASSQ